MSRPDTRWWAKGDLNAFFGLITDNMTQLVLCAGFLVGIFGFPADIVLSRMLPGTALGVLLGDLAYTWMGVRLSRKSGRPVTAMPLGIDTPSLFAVCFIMLGPLFKAYAQAMPAHDAGLKAWKVGMALMVMSGIFKLAVAPFGDAVRKLFPRIALLAPLAGIAVCLIAFLPMLEIFAHPVTGLVVLAVILAALVAGWRTPFGIPGALLAVGVGCLIQYRPGGSPFPGFIQPAFTPPLPTLGFLGEWREALRLFPVALPFALATIVGGIDCAESAAAAGDEYDTRAVLAVEGAATLVGGLCGGVIQTTPYIGHPAYKRMGGRSGYTLATALFIGLGGVLGVLPFFVALLPKVALVPILCFIGLEITAQAFRASAPRHAPAGALAFLPCLAYLLLIAAESFNPLVGSKEQTARMVLLLSNGFIVTAFLWAAAGAWLIDREAWKAVGALLLCGALSLCGVIHSPKPAGEVFWPWHPGIGITAPPESQRIGLGYAAAAGAVALLALAGGAKGKPEEA